MTTELFVNTPHQAVTLSGAIATAPVAGTVETWAVTIAGVSGTQFPLPTIGSGQMRMATETAEVILVTAGTTTAGDQSLTVTRGADNTTPTAHSTGAALVAKVTAAALALPNAHASSHVGSDSILAYMAAAQAQMSGHLMVPFDLRLGAGIVTPTAGVLKMTKLLTPYTFTINSIDSLVRQAGTGVTSLANCFLAIFDSSGQRQYVSADQSSSWNSIGTKTLSVAGGYTVTAGSYIYVAVLVGTQSTTSVGFAGINSGVIDPWTINQTAATYGNATNSSALTSVPSSITLSSDVAATTAIWFGVR